MVDTVLERHGRLDGLVNNVGAIKTRKGFLEQRQPGARRQRGGPAPGHPGDRLRSDEDGPRFRTWWDAVGRRGASGSFRASLIIGVLGQVTVLLMFVGCMT